jgi:outer membrane protein assembly factor BamE (lipoprotein component of BamABCDE complex)
MRLLVPLAPLVLGVLAFSSASCAVLSSSSHTERSGNYIGEETLRQVQPGHSQEYVRALFGDPTSRSAVSEGVELWKWTYEQETRSSGSVLLVFSSRRSTESGGAVYVEFTDAQVSKIWRD